MSKETLGRRAALKRALAVVGSAALLPVIKACGGEEEGLSCNDTSGLSPADVTTRTSNGYVDHSQFSDKNCLNCQFYQAGQPNQCGTCTVVRGPIHPEGYCNLWAPKQS